MIQKYVLSVLYLCTVLIFAQSCNRDTKEETIQDPMVASVGNRSLLSSDLKLVIHPNVNSQDSLELATAYIDQWVRDQLLTEEAIHTFSADPEIQSLVQDYREKLLKFRLEEKILAERYDTIITKNELEAFYDEMKEQFVLNSDIYRCIFAGFKRGTPGLDEFKTEWRNGDLQEIFNFVNAYSSESQLDTMRWHTWDDISDFGGGFVKSRVEGGDFETRRDSEYEYFLKVFEKVDIASISPLTYIEPQLRNMLLYKRKQNILQEYRQELFEKALNKNAIKLP